MNSILNTLVRFINVSFPICRLRFSMLNFNFRLIPKLSTVSRMMINCEVENQSKESVKLIDFFLLEIKHVDYLSDKMKP